MFEVIRRRGPGLVVALSAVVLGVAPATSAVGGSGVITRPAVAVAANLADLVRPLTHELTAAHRVARRRRRQIGRLRRRRTRVPELLRTRMRSAWAPLAPEIRGGGSAVEARRRSAAAFASLRHLRARIESRIAGRRRGLRRLRVRDRRLEARLRRVRPIGVCPVEAATTVSDDFGAPRFDHGEYHAHQGNDISAPLGSPIVAPFDGRAVVATNELGGLAVDVIGSAGHVYNAHLSRLGRLGRVTTGDVIGYVGESGNAASPHDHFEWHPLDGPAVDPHALLMLVCRV
jgi:murein DD-endopeptidase MepM/ murein hydrolase activator NlpD